MGMLVGRWGVAKQMQSQGQGGPRAEGHRKRSSRQVQTREGGTPGGEVTSARFWKPSRREEEAQTPGEWERRFMESRINGNDGTVTVRARDLRRVADTLAELKPFRKN